MASATFPDDHRQYQPYQPWYQRPLYHPWSVHPELLLPPAPWFCEKSIQPRPNHSCGTPWPQEDAARVPLPPWGGAFGGVGGAFHGVRTAAGFGIAFACGPAAPAVVRPAAIA